MKHDFWSRNGRKERSLHTNWKFRKRRISLRLVNIEKDNRNREELNMGRLEGNYWTNVSRKQEGCWGNKFVAGGRS